MLALERASTTNLRRTSDTAEAVSAGTLLEFVPSGGKVCTIFRESSWGIVTNMPVLSPSAFMMGVKQAWLEMERTMTNYGWLESGR